MQNYIRHLLSDIADATENISSCFVYKELRLQDWLSDEEEDKTAPVRNLQEWTGIYDYMLPPPHLLDDEQVSVLLNSLQKMLDACYCCFVLQAQVPERIQYAVLKDNFNQSVKIKQWHSNFFKVCREGTEHLACALGSYCECALFAELFSTFEEEAITPEEERKRHLNIEVNHIKKKYGDDWMRYYPYHLDAEYDDDGNAYNYGFHDEDEDDD